jgi:hypothetical protein
MQTSSYNNAQSLGLWFVVCRLPFIAKIFGVSRQLSVQIIHGTDLLAPLCLIYAGRCVPVEAVTAV